MNSSLPAAGAVPGAPAQVRPTRPGRIEGAAFRWLLFALFFSHFFVLFMKATSGFLPTSLTALIPTAVTLLLYGLTLLALVERRLRAPVHLLDVVIVLFMALSLAQVFNDHVTVVFGLRAWQRTAFFAGMYFAGLYLVNTPERVGTLLHWTALSVGLAGLVAIAQSVFGLNLEGSYALLIESLSGAETLALAQQRAYGTLVSQAAFGLLSALGVLLALTSWIVAGTWSRRATALIALGLSTAGLLLSGTRSAMLGLAIGVLPLFWLIFGQSILRLLFSGRLRVEGLITMIALGVAVAVLAVFIQTSESTTAVNTLNRLRTILPTTWLRGDLLQEGNVVSRMDIWRPVLDAIAERPLIGYGTGVLGGGSAANRIGVQTINGQTMADNQFLELWGELGLPGLLLYLVALATMASLWLRRRSPRFVYALSLLLVGVAGLFAVSGMGNAPLDYYPVNAIFWLLLGMGMNLGRFQRILRARAVAGRGA